jgi:hypothetical protein
MESKYNDLLKEWRTTCWWKGRCVDTNDWAHGPSWEELVSMGEVIAPLIIDTLEHDVSAFPLLILWECIFKDKPEYIVSQKGLTIEELRRGEQGRAERQVAHYKTFFNIGDATQNSNR